MIITSAAVTNKGKLRSRNEDNLFLDGVYRTQTDRVEDRFQSDVQSSTHAFAVCDGMGGEKYGDEASLIAVSTFSEMCLSERPFTLKQYIDEANRRICHACEEKNTSHMGSTAAILFLDGREAHICNVGDSRIYQYDNDVLIQLSEDHRSSLAASRPGVLSQHLGVSPDEYILGPYFKSRIAVRPGMLFVLCSDGLTDMVPNDQLEQILAASHDKEPANIADCLVDTALQNGGRDNVTVIVVKIS